MNRNIIITLISLLTLSHTICHADALDDLLKQLEQAELKPAAKKAPASAPKTTGKQPLSKGIPGKKITSKKPASKPQAVKPQDRSLATPSRATSKAVTPQPIAQEFLEKTPTTRKDKGISKREQRINTFFQTKISPIAESMFKLVESKETQQLVETAKKKRLEHEKATAAKFGKGMGAKPRYSQVGSSSGGRGGTGGWGGAGKGYDSGYGSFGGYGGSGSGGHGRGSWAPSSTSFSHGFESPTSKTDSLKTGSPATQDKKEKEESLSRTKSTDKDDFGPEQQQVLNLSDNIQRKLSSWLTKLDDAPTPAAKQKVFTEIGKQLSDLKQKVDSRSNALSDSGKLPPAVSKSLREQIKNKEEGLWKRLIKHDANFEAHETAQSIKGAVDKHNTLLARETILSGAGAPSQALSSDETKDLQTIRDQLANIKAKITAGPLLDFRLRLEERLINPGTRWAPAGGLPGAPAVAGVARALEDVKADFFTIELKTSIDDFFAPAP